MRVYTNGIPETEDASDYDVSLEFDASIKVQLDEAALLALQEVNSENGYVIGCYPITCDVYIAALYGETVKIVDNHLDLMSFLGEIDRPAELHFIFNELEAPYYYKELEDGYEVLTFWTDCNGRDGVNLQHVGNFGNVTLLENLLDQERGGIC